MTTYASPFGSQRQTELSPTNSRQLLDQKEFEEIPYSGSRESWQIVPPIVTEGRLAAVNTQQAMQEERDRQVTSSQESATLFKVSFTGLDQQRYSVSAVVKQPTNGELLGQELASGQLLRGATSGITRPQSLLRPAWQAPASPAEAAREWSPMATPPTASASLWQEASMAEGMTLGRSNIQESGPLDVKKEETDKDFLLQIVQPSLVGLMDGSVSTLAPIFAVAFATQRPFTTFLVGMASALGAGISMAFSEALSDDGDLTGRGKPFLRGGITGVATFLSGAGHALPFLIPNLELALFVAYAVVAIELFAIAAIRHKFFGTSWWLSIVQVVGGGALVFAAALLLGHG